MRLVTFFAVVCTLAAPAAQRPSAFLPVAVEYAAGRDATRASIASDLQVIRSLHFNSIRYTLRWSDAEPARGTLMVEPLERVLEAATQSGLRVIVRLETGAPAWVFARYADASRRTSDEAAPRAACFDHPAVRGDMWRFVTAASTTAARHSSLLAIDAGSDPPAGLCLCPHTRQRAQAEGGADRDNPAALVKSLLRADLAALAARVREGAPVGVPVTSHARRPALLRSIDGGAPGQDDGLMRTAVDQYGTTIDAKSSSPARLALALDAISGGGVRPGWSLDLDPSIPERDRRLVTWAAISRGARALIFEDPPEPGVTATIARNPALFSQLVPRPARVALVDDSAGRSSDVAQRLASIHQALAARHVAADILPVDRLSTEVSARYRVIVNGSAAAIAAADVGEIARRAGGPEVRIEGGDGVEVRMLESDSLQMIVGLNYAAESRRVAMTFPPDTQEAIWQNMETGAGVNFIAGAGANGPSYTYWFRPKDALVLMIRKDIR